MYLPDLSPYPYGKHPSKLSVGWLDSSYEYTQGDTPISFIERLAVFCQKPVLHTLGRTQCGFCRNATGSGQVWVFGSTGIVYVAPDLIYHYVVKHHYCPPEGFIEAVLDGPLPDTEEYQGLVNQLRQRKSAP
jgi:hypothetical protein